jgi:hypothetical protein
MSQLSGLFRFTVAAVLAASALPWPARIPAQTPLPGHGEIIALHSTTYIGEELLRGHAKGKDVLLGGELRLPFNVPGKVPAVVLVPGMTTSA